MTNISQISALIETNFKQWETKFRLFLGMMKYDRAFRYDRPKPADKDGVATPEEKADIEKWDDCYRLCIMVMKITTHETLQDCIPDKDSGAKEYLKALEEKFAMSKKTDIRTLMVKLTTIKYKGKTGIREHIT